MAKQTSQSPPDLSIEPTHDNLFKFTYHREDGVDDLSRELFEIVFDEATNNEFNWLTLNMDSSSVIDQAGREKFADLIFSVNTKEDNSSTKFIFLLEHKSASDSNALMQLLGYQTSLYLREGKQCRVLPMIIYNGKKPNWSGPLEFQLSLQPVSDHLQREWGGYFLNFRCKMVNLHEVIAQRRAAGMDSEVVLYALSKVWNADERTFEKVFRLAKGLSDEKRNRLLPMVVNYLQSHLTHMEISRICQHTGMSRKQVEQIQNNLQRH